LAAKRVCQSLGAGAEFVVGDARCLPFQDGSIDVVFSYSVLQHFSREDTTYSLREVRRVLREGTGNSLIQMPNRYGVRSLYHQVRRGFREPKDFEVRYWTPRELNDLFQDVLGKSDLTADCYFGLGLQAADCAILPRRYRAIIRMSELLRRWSGPMPWLRLAADSVYMHSKAR
jgi:SAM-dependent methyltransferase